jgi:cell division protein FtsZ
MSEIMKDYKFDIPKNHKSIIKVIGVGGGGSNAVNHMFNQGIKDVEFVVANTDSQALKSSPVPLKLQIGANLTEGLGAGANPEKGKNAALESKEEIRDLLSDNTKMVFITAGMGGGTGTGAAPVIAKIAKDMDILTVGIVTAPFIFEGRKKTMSAQDGIESLRANCDTVLVILNDKLREIYGNLPIRQAFGKADNILSTAAKSIAQIITVHQDVNVDFEDVKTVMKDAGAAVMGSATEEGEDRAIKAAEKAIQDGKFIEAERLLRLARLTADEAAARPRVRQRPQERRHGRVVGLVDPVGQALIALGFRVPRGRTSDGDAELPDRLGEGRRQISLANHYRGCRHPWHRITANC